MNSIDANERHLVILNQAANYLTIGFANAFNRRFDSVSLITGSVHVQGAPLDPDIEICRINRWHERPAWKKAASYLLALFRMWWLLMTRYRRHEVLFVSVPPMAYLLNLLLPHRFSMVIWDVYPDIFKIKGMSERHPLFRAWAWLNRRSFRRAWRIFTISEPMAELLTKYVDRSRIHVHPIWSIFQENQRVAKRANPFVEAHGLVDKFVVQYSGNIGLTHNVEALIDIAANLQDQPEILFQIIGRGPRKPLIEGMVQERGLANVQFLPFQSDDMFPFSLSAADLGVVMLHDSVSRGSIPSKAYNLMSFGIPALYIAAADSELARYAQVFGNARCFEAGQIAEVSGFIRALAAAPAQHRQMSEKADAASRLFRVENADRFVSSYFSVRGAAASESASAND